MSKYSRELKRQELEKTIQKENEKPTDSVDKNTKERPPLKSAPDRKIQSNKKKAFAIE